MKKSLTGVQQMALIQGGFYLITGIWPILNMKSFEKVSGNKNDHWLVKTVGALLIATGGNLLYSASSRKLSKHLKAVVMTQALALTAIDVIYSSKGIISKVYLLDAATELLIVTGWARA